MPIVAERSVRITPPITVTPPAHRWWVTGLSLACAALCGWVLLPLFISVGLVVLAAAMWLGAVGVAVFLVAVGSRPQ